MPETLDLADCVNAVCPWSGDPVSGDSLTLYRGKVVGFCNPGCRDKFEKATSSFDAAIDGN
ncbi:glutathione S-transferase [Erythrobacter sp. KY5]|uniref:glutathione S-transferase n=1 Tax=Erythrobacter sp. KY5 TaxID=2011159 RepID=UPI000DBF0DDD|nr:glutathione S-transferase [Erythrobacter sp. KY5]AWW75280.1 glutathione S-transferase [Erythrobacter sp. KY5]